MSRWVPHPTPSDGVPVAELRQDLEVTRAEREGLAAANDQLWARVKRIEQERNAALVELDRIKADAYPRLAEQMEHIAIARAAVADLANANNDLCMERDSARHDLAEALALADDFFGETETIERLKVLLVEVATAYRDLLPLQVLDRDLIARIDAAVAP